MALRAMHELLAREDLWEDKRGRAQREALLRTLGLGVFMAVQGVHQVVQELRREATGADRECS